MFGNGRFCAGYIGESVERLHQEVSDMSRLIKSLTFKKSLSFSILAISIALTPVLKCTAGSTVIDDDGNKIFYNDDGMETGREKVPVPYKKPPGKTVKLPNGKDAYQEADGTIRYLDDKNNVIEVKQNPKDPNKHSILQQLLNGINALTNEGGDTKIQMPGSGTWGFDPQGHLESTPYGPYGAPPGAGVARSVGDDGVVTTTYTDPNFGGVTTVVDGRTMKPSTPGGQGMPTTTITDPSGNKIVQTPNGPLIYGPDGKIISKAGFEPQSLGGEGHHHGPDGSEIPNSLFQPLRRNTTKFDNVKGTVTVTIEEKDPATGEYKKVSEDVRPMDKTDPNSKPLFMKAYDSDVVEEKTPENTGKPFSKALEIKAKMGGPFKIKADVKATGTNTTKSMK